MAFHCYFTSAVPRVAPVKTMASANGFPSASLTKHFFSKASSCISFTLLVFQKNSGKQPFRSSCLHSRMILGSASIPGWSLAPPPSEDDPWLAASQHSVTAPPAAILWWHQSPGLNISEVTTASNIGVPCFLLFIQIWGMSYPLLNQQVPVWMDGQNLVLP